MCGRFSLGGSATILASHFNVQESLAWTPRYNLAPSQEVLTLVQPSGSAREIRRMRWGLIPAWAKIGIGNPLINARAETVAAKPAFRVPLRHRRCLVLTDGFYEWASRGGRKQPWFIRMQDGRPFAFAGLWDLWTDPEGKGVESCVIITTTPNSLIQRFHHRMPVILSPADYNLWLDVERHNVDRILPLLKPYPPEVMTAYPVSPLVNSPANDSTACQSPADQRKSVDENALLL